VECKFLATSSRDAHTASRCAESIIAISLSLNKEMAKENQPRGLIPLGTPQRKKVAALSLCSSFCETKQIQPLRWRFDIKTPTGKTHAINKSKNFCRLLRTLRSHRFQAKRKLKTFAFSACRTCWLHLKHAPRTFNQISSLSLQCGNAGEVPEGTSGRVFLVRSLPRGKE